MIQKSVIILSNTSTTYDVTGESFRADSWYGRMDGNHTISVTFYGLKGNFYIQGTLSLEPTESDWFNIYINPDDATIPHIYFDGESGTKAYSFTGNFLHVRAKLARTERVDLTPVDGQATPEQGQIDKVILAY